MSITECMTITSPSPTNGPNARRPEALGETISLGTPTGSACIAAAPSRAPSAPPRHSTPCMRPSAYSRRHVGADPLEHQLDGGAARARRAHVVELVPAGAAPPPRAGRRPRSPGSPRIPESTTTGRVPSARRRSRT